MPDTDKRAKRIAPITHYARKAFWHPVNELPKLAFDHTEILKRL
jgi:8-oxo-dGTP diphosphatase